MTISMAGSFRFAVASVLSLVLGVILGGHLRQLISFVKDGKVRFTRQCDLLPLVNGHNVWDVSSNELVRGHTREKYICGPKILIVGAMKCGTNTIGRIIQKHPRVKVNRCPGKFDDCNTTFFQGAPPDHLWEGNDVTVHQVHNPDDWLQSWAARLPWTDGIQTWAIDKSPSYSNTVRFSDVARSVHDLLPNAKVVMTLCNPSERVFSEFHHYHDKAGHVAVGWREKFQDYGLADESHSFDNFTEFLFYPDKSSKCKGNSREFCREQKRTFLGMGEYGTNVKAWHQVYGHGNVLVLNMEDDNERKAQQLLEHVALPLDEYPWKELREEAEEAYSNTHYSGRSSSREFPDSMKKLQEYYYLDNLELSRLIGEDFPLDWNADSSNF